jgi:hypothetical protein
MTAGQVSAGAGYVKPFQGQKGEEPREDEYLSVDARVGTGAGFDVGASYFSEITHGEWRSYLFDGRYQITNHENTVGTPMITVGLGKGHIIDEETHITRPSFAFGMPVSSISIVSLTYQADMFSEEFLPGSSEDDLSARHNVTLGAEFDLGERGKGKIVPKIGVGAGYLFGNDWKSAYLFNIGISIDTP